MGHVEIYETYQDLPQHEAFEAFASNSVDPDLIEGLLGEDVLDDYATWQYFNLK